MDNLSIDTTAADTVTTLSSVFLLYRLKLEKLGNGISNCLN